MKMYVFNIAMFSVFRAINKILYANMIYKIMFFKVTIDN